MKHIIRVRVKTSNKTYLLLKLNRINIDIKNIKYEDNYLYFNMFTKDLERLNKYLISYDVEIIDDVGIYKLKKALKVNMLFIVSIIFSCLVFMILNNLTIKVNIIHQDKSIRELIDSDLKEFGVKPLSFKKSYKEYEEIINIIKGRHKDSIEWLEIDVDGMIVNIRVEERKELSEEVKDDYCHIVAKNGGIITSIYTSRGTSLVSINDYVKKGDILISGEIKLNEEVRGDVCANGKVYAEVWYKVNTSFPLEYIETKETGKMRFNMMLKKGEYEYVILKSRVKDSMVENKYITTIFNYELYLQKEKEVIKTAKKYTLDEAENKAIDLIHEKLILKESETPKIIKEKVLQKSVNNDKLDIEMFIAVEEQIGKKAPYTKEMDSDTSDGENNSNYNTVN